MLKNTELENVLNSENLGIGYKDTYLKLYFAKQFINNKKITKWVITYNNDMIIYELFNDAIKDYNKYLEEIKI